MSRNNGSRSGGSDLYEIRKSRIQGRGVFARRRIRPGQRIVEYTGEKIPSDEADRRYDEEGMERHHTFLFTLDDDYCIDGDVATNRAKLINHSCDPNCEAVIEGGRIWIYALKNIQPGVELAYDYQYERTGDNIAELEKFYVCLCGSPRCRGSIMAPPKKRRKKKKARNRARRTTKRDSTR